MNFYLNMAPEQFPMETVAPIPPAPRKRKTDGLSLKQTFAQLALFAVLSTASYFLFSHFLVQSVQVTGVSMTPTLHDGEQYMLNRWPYHHRDPQRGEVVVIRDPEDNGFTVKRIIATAGESVLFKNGEVYVNNEKLDEPYLFAGTKTPTFSQSDEKLILVGNGYFVLGDNRWNSADSRLYGPVPRKNILGLIPQ